MSHKLHTILRLNCENGFIARARQLACALALALLLPVVAVAYTVVMRSGHRVEIPDTFEVTAATLTYESGNGIYVTLQMSSIDIAATERANGENAGSLLKRVGRQLASQTPPAKNPNAPRATRTLTNLDLEGTRQRRLESEAAYGRRRKELGLPSQEEMERRRQEESARAREMLSQSEGAEAEAESYWRTRATSLRNELYALDAQINYLRARLNETSDTIPTVSFATLGSPAPFIFSTGRQQPSQPPAAGYQSPSAGGRNNALLVGTAGNAGGQTREQVFSSFSNSFGLFKHRRVFNSCLFAPCVPSFGLTYPYNYNSYDRSALITQIRELEATRAGLQARWRLLEDEARRAGAQPGWLRP
ncbi:MAG TPA: hypothetical protein VGC91_07720 [Pyrinomonadaceae bacterium]